MGADILDRNLSFFRHTKFMYRHDLAILLMGTHLREIFSQVHKERCMRKSITVLLVVPRREASDCPSSGSK